jgi:probable HAF family extracellular repeat protein
MKRYTLAAVAVLLVLVPWHQALRADLVPYTIEDLGTLGGLVPTITGVNAAGQVSGYVDLPSGSRAVRFTDGVGWAYLPGLDLTYSVATGINAHGDLTGYHVTAAGAIRAFRYYSSTGVVEDLAPLPGGTSTFGMAINAAADVAGYSDTPAGVRGFRAAVGLPAVQLPTLGGVFGSACGVNDAGQVAGVATDAAGHQHAVRIDPNLGMFDASTFNGAAGTSHACAIDSDGLIGGYAAAGTGYHAFTFDGLTLKRLDDVFVTTFSSVEAIAAGTSVGWFNGADRTAHAFVHTNIDGSTELNSRLPAGSGWVLRRAKSVNARGQIVGEGLLNGAARVFRLTPAAPKDTTPPVITSLTATPSRIWPPNGRMVNVVLSVTATDDVDQSPTCALTSVTGAPAADVEITGALTARLRAAKDDNDQQGEHEAQGDSDDTRVYVLHVTCSDRSQNKVEGTVNVTVARPRIR